MIATIILSFRANSTGERYANLERVLRWLAETPQYPVVVVEQDSVQRLTQPLPHPASRVVFAYNPGPFNKAWGLNVGARLATTPVLVFNDADLLVPGTLVQCVENCAARYPMVKPYRRLLDLSPEATARVLTEGLAALNDESGMATFKRDEQGEYPPLCGGSFAMRTDAFHALGGWDERFVGWGGEDDAMTYKVQRARLPTLEFDDAAALHLWHPREIDASGHVHYADNVALVERYRHYSQAELLRLAEVQLQIMGQLDKYRPAQLKAAP